MSISEQSDGVVVGHSLPVRWFIGSVGALLVLLGTYGLWLLATHSLQPDEWKIAFAPLIAPLGALMLVSAMRRSWNCVTLDPEGFTATKLGWKRRVRWQDVERLDLYFVKFWSGASWKTLDGRSGGTPAGLELPAEELLDLMRRFRQRALGDSPATLAAD